MDPSTSVAAARGVPTAGTRREHIRERVAAEGFASVAELAAMFSVSEVTVRNDLERLAARGQVRRVRGGAVPRTLELPERSFEQTAGVASAAKAAIGRAAAGLVSSGETVILDVGTTTTAVARALVARDGLADVTVITSGLTTALELEPGIPRLSVLVTGGTLRPLQHSLVEPMGSRMFAELYADVVFLGCNGVDPERGITNVNLPEVEIKRRALAAANRRVVVADGSKLGRVAFAAFGQLDDIDVLITSEDADPEILAAIEDQGVTAIVADSAA